MRNPSFFPLPHGITVRVHRVHRGSRVKHGDKTYAYSHDIVGCAMAPRYSTEITQPNRHGTIVGFSLFGPPGSDILAEDRIETADGNFYNVVGEAAEWANPFTGVRAGFEAALERVT